MLLLERPEVARVYQAISRPRGTTAAQIATATKRPLDAVEADLEELRVAHYALRMRRHDGAIVWLADTGNEWDPTALLLEEDYR